MNFIFFLRKHFLVWVGGLPGPQAPPHPTQSVSKGLAWPGAPKIHGLRQRLGGPRVNSCSKHPSSRQLTVDGAYIGSCLTQCCPAVDSGGDGGRTREMEGGRPPGYGFVATGTYTQGEWGGGWSEAKKKGLCT